MTPELTVLALAGLLQGVQFLLMAIPVNLEVGPGKTMSPRDASRMDKPMVELVSDKTGRLVRAMNNHFEGLILFTIAVVVVTLGDQSSPVTRAAAQIYLIARLIYIPCYVLGLSPWRSLVWMVGLAATVTMLIAALI